ncbi:hypothetical protein [Kitasatospora purpeofusca]|uniref:hypothetical protein n=1 Tax=Kitasatospora purpeofusca TaxID=67352 RepID=UPI00224F9FB2|nr:hypothetical protein [Kitasatospora purpeofusca]MCX4682721.1 hypothetical protein [Kitasatospora purpeofusca]MCX4690615.1 hypothetical protein [Kitasatospora purpeofusca]MCX4690797.1 hypothetical protein [Kitasatospora purpeofusca]
MTSAVPFSRPVRPAPVPGDAERAPRELMTLPGASRDIRRWRLVEIRLSGDWKPAMLTVWRRPPGSTVWVVHVRWDDDATVPQGQPWGWFLFDERTVRPLPEPDDPPPARAPFHGVWRDALTVPAELAGAPDPDGADRCWRLAWVRTGGGWRSGVVTARRRPGPDVPWIALTRWGEDKQSSWLLYDPAAVRILPPADVPGDRPGAGALGGAAPAPAGGPGHPEPGAAG